MATAASAVFGENVAGLQTFSIPSQSLEIALRLYSEATGVEVLYDARLVVGRRSAAIDGSFPPDTALGLMLRRTGLRPRYTAAHAIILVPIPSDMSDALPVDTIRIQALSDVRDRARFEAFGEALLSHVVAAIQRDRLASKGSYHATVRLWTDPRGSVRASEIIDCTCDSEQARSLGPAIRNTDAGQLPPVGLPQPIVYRFEIHAPTH